MSRQQRNTWGINIERAGPKESYNANPPPACLSEKPKGYYTNFSNIQPQLSAGSRPYSGIGKRRMKDDDDYFNDDEDYKEPELEYIPAPGSPGLKVEEKHESDGSEDPLDAYMNEIDNQVEKQKDKAFKPNQAKRYDIEKEDEIESYIKFMEQNPNFGAGEDDDVAYEYDNDGNIVNKEKKAVEPLPLTDHSIVNYKDFEKNFYVPHEEIIAMSGEKANELLDKLGISVRGKLPPKPVCSFAHFGFDEKLMNTIRKSSFTQPTPIQAQGIPAALSGRDVIGIAKTGSGKTAAFLWPMIVHIMDQPELKLGDGPIGLICAPTRELAIQIYQEAKKYSSIYNIQVVCAYGGGNMYEQQKACESGCEILVCTPGRLIDMVKKKSTNLRRVTFLVFDEADKMFNLGFGIQVNSIAKNVRPDRQTLLFSATFKYKVERLAREALTDPIKIVQGQVGEASEDVTQIIEVLNKEDDKWGWLRQRIVKFTSHGNVLIFTTRKITAVELSQKLKDNGHENLLLHGDVHQVDRNNTIQTFKKEEVKIMVATDVAARGLDIPAIKTVVNYDVARDIDTHTHRIGRTGRAGNQGIAHTLVTKEKDKEFAGHLVRNLEGASQHVPYELLQLANQSSWFKKSRNTMDAPGKSISNNLGVRRRAGIGSSSFDDSSSSSRRKSPDIMEMLSRGPQSDRLSTMRAAFTNQYNRQFVSAGIEGTVYTHPERLGDEHKPSESKSTFKMYPPPPPQHPSQTEPSPKVVKKKKTRWG